MRGQRMRGSYRGKCVHKTFMQFLERTKTWGIKTVGPAALNLYSSVAASQSGPLRRIHASQGATGRGARARRRLQSALQAAPRPPRQPGASCSGAAYWPLSSSSLAPPSAVTSTSSGASASCGRCTSLAVSQAGLRCAWPAGRSRQERPGWPCCAFLNRGTDGARGHVEGGLGQQVCSSAAPRSGLTPAGH